MAAGQGARPRPEERSSVGAASVNLTKNLIGAGIFSLPMALLQGSLLPGLGVMLLACIVQGGSFVLIAYLCQQLHCTSYRDVFATAFGKRAGTAVDVCICTNAFFACVSYNILVADFQVKALEGLFGIIDFHRAKLIWMNTLLITMPLSHVRNLSALRYTSILGLAIIAFVISYVVSDFYSSRAVKKHNLHLHMYRVDIGLFSTLALCTGAFQAHYNSPKFFRELGCDLAAHRRVVVMSFAAALCIYSSFAISGLGLFGSELCGNVLKNYPAEGNRFVLLSWLGMAFAIVFTYPLVFTTGRDSFIGLMPAIQKAAQKRPLRTHMLCTSIPVALIAAVACLVQDVSVVTGTLGATVGASLCWIFPASTYLRVTSAAAAELHECKAPLIPSGTRTSRGPVVRGSPGQRACARAMVVIGLLSMAVGLSKTFGLL